MHEQMVAHYLLEEKLFDSPTGPLYRAHDTRLDRTVALKILPAGLGEDAAAHQRFIEEVRAAGNIGNPAIPAIHEVGQADDGRLFVAMAFTPGQFLRTKLAAGPLPLPQALSVATQIARALAAAHEKGIVHRDVQPGTVLVDETGTAKLLDFGLARLVGASAQTRTATLSGNQGYLPPELLEGRQVGTRADIWSVGALLSESLGAARGQTPAELRLVIDRCLRKDPEERYASAVELADDLEEVAAGLGKGTLKSTKLHAGRRPPRRWMVAAAIAAAAVVATAALVVTLWWKPWLPRTTERVTIVLLPIVPDGLADDDMLDEMLTDGLMTDLTKILQLRVISQNSARTIKPEETIADVAKKLNVDYVVKGRARRDGGRVKLDLDLWRVKPEQLAWEQELAGADEALDALESNAAEEVALRSGVRLTPEDHARLATRPAVKREAYELYLKAKTLDYWDNENSERATAYLTRAIEIDPTFAVAYTALIPIYYNLGSPDDLKRADEMGQRALELDPTNAEVLYYEAAFAYYGGRQAESIAMFLELDAANPTNSDLQGKLANALSTLGLCEQALESGREALRIDPINLQNHFNYTWACLSCREWEQGVAGFEKFLDLYPDNALPHGNYALLLQGMGRYEEALEHCRISRELAGIDPTADWSIGSLLACLGREAEARAIAEKAARRWEEDKRSWRTTTASDAVGLISLFVCLGEYDQALHWLSETVEAGAGYGLNWPLFFYDPIREFPEATELARKAGAPEWSLKRIEPAWSPKTAGASR